MSITRRQAIKIGSFAAVSALGYGGYRCLTGRKEQDVAHLDHLYPFIKPALSWTSLEISAFLGNLREDEQRLILSSLGTPIDTNFDVAEIKTQVVWLASNVVTYPFRDKTDCNYHDYILQWLASEYGITGYKDIVSSFVLERKILDSIFVQMWDKLTPDQRRQILDSIDKEGAITDKAGIALAEGAIALVELSATVHFAGFRYYTSMSTVIKSTADFFGLKVPFKVYQAASKGIKMLSGPVGWAIFALAAMGAVVFLGRADATKTAAFVTQLHLLKVQSLRNSHRLDRILGDLALK